jgi:predicted GTPase
VTVAQYSINDSFDNFRKLFVETCELEKRLSKTFYGIQPEMSDITKALNEIQWQLDNPAPVTIALLGSTGAGKSTLINTLIGSEILPLWL